MSEPVRVFVSYASPDRAFAEKLVADLQAAGAEVWWDVSGIDEGDFLGKINQALQQCQWLVLVLTPNAIASKWVNIEVNAAINRREKGLMRGVLPMLASQIRQDAIPPIWDNLHRYDGVSNYPTEVARLIRTFGLSGASAEPPPAASVIPIGPPSYLPPRLAQLGYRGMYFPDGGGTEVIVPPLCEVPAGPFLMGSDPNKDKDAQEDEQPQHRVTVEAFQIAKYPVTVAEYFCFLRAGHRGRSQLAQVEHPAVDISWQDAMEYVRWLSERTGQTWRLPSEAEWEKAARGTDGRIYPWGSTFDESRCNSNEGGVGDTTPIGAYESGASPCGALDMAGNVWEWASGLYKPYPYKPRDGREQVESITSRGLSAGSRVRRGGSWFNHGRYARVACRMQTNPNYVSNHVGFRLACSVPSA
jgi:formylglycine-generating enzyme required for sulfatase activity